MEVLVVSAVSLDLNVVATANQTSGHVLSNYAQ